MRGIAIRYDRRARHLSESVHGDAVTRAYFLDVIPGVSARGGSGICCSRHAYQSKSEGERSAPDAHMFLPRTPRPLRDTRICANCSCSQLGTYTETVGLKAGTDNLFIGPIAPKFFPVPPLLRVHRVLCAFGPLPSVDMRSHAPRNGPGEKMDDDTDDLVEMMRRIDRMNHEQRAIATLQAFDDDDAAGRWIEQHKQEILAGLRQAQ